MIEVSDLSFRVGAFAVEKVSMRVEDGEYFVLMGQTGSGKSLVVKCLCGLVRPREGRIVIGGRNVTDSQPRARLVGYLPQDYALFPHMDVARNITFPLRVRGKSHAAALREVAAVLSMLALEELLARRTDTLSGGETQKVALARALAARPALLVLDEPVSALDEPTRAEICKELLGVQRRLRLATIHVCHSTAEAAALADRVGIMHQGRLVQTGTLDELRRQPRDEAVARLLRPGP